MHSGNVTEVNYGAGIMETLMNHSVYNTKNIPFRRQIYSKCSGRKVIKEEFFFFVDIMVGFFVVLFCFFQTIVLYLWQTRYSGSP